jgi:hypothetical protein
MTIIQLQSQTRILPTIKPYLNIAIRGGNLSESEGEDGTMETVGVPQKLSARGTKGVDEVGLKLVELGPRLKLQVCDNV